jgi:hypothetical protein
MENNIFKKIEDFFWIENAERSEAFGEYWVIPVKNPSPLLQESWDTRSLVVPAPVIPNGFPLELLCTHVLPPGLFNALDLFLTM